MLGGCEVDFTTIIVLVSLVFGIIGSVVGLIPFIYSFKRDLKNDMGNFKDDLKGHLSRTEIRIEELTTEMKEENRRVEHRVLEANKRNIKNGWRLRYLVEAHRDLTCFIRLRSCASCFYFQKNRISTIQSYKFPVL